MCFLLPFKQASVIAGIVPGHHEVAHILVLDCDGQLSNPDRENSTNLLQAVLVAFERRPEPEVRNVYQDLM